MGNAASEVQHIVNQVQGVGPQEKAFMTAVHEGKVDEAAELLKASGAAVACCQ